MNKRKREQIEKAKQRYLETFDVERAFFEVVDTYLEGNSPKDVSAVVEEKNIPLNEALIHVFLDDEETFEIYFAFKDSLSNYLDDVETCLILEDDDTPMVLGYKLGAYVERIKRMMEKVLEFRGKEGTWTLGLKYKEDYLRYVEQLKKIAGLPENIAGVNHRITQQVEYYAYERNEVNNQ